MALQSSPESTPPADSEFDPNMSIMSQALRIVAPTLITEGSQEIAQQRMIERSIDQINAEELRR